MEKRKSISEEILKQFGIFQLKNRVLHYDLSRESALLSPEACASITENANGKNRQFSLHCFEARKVFMTVLENTLFTLRYVLEDGQQGKIPALVDLNYRFYETNQAGKLRYPFAFFEECITIGVRNFMGLRKRKSQL